MEMARILGERGMQYKDAGTNQYVVKICPFCHDTKEKVDNLWKLYINKESGLFLCHRCQTRGNARQFMEKLGTHTHNDHRFNLVNQYLYQDETGSTYLRVTRLEDNRGNKTFYQERLEEGFWKKGGACKPLQPFCFAEWKHEETIVIVEGEKCVFALRSLGFAATTFVGGCNGWKKIYANYFQNKHVILLPDHDSPGLKFMSLVATDISNVVASYKIVFLPGLRDKEDIYDWVKNGGIAKDFIEICKKTETNNLSCLQEKAHPHKEPSHAWAKLKDLPSVHTHVQDISPEIIPEVLRSWITDIAERMQVPLVCVTVLALTVVGSIIGRKARIYPKKEDDWYEVANLWSMIIMPSGRLKSPMINSVLKPLHELSEQAETEFAAFAKEAEIEKAVSDAKVQAAKKEIQKIAGSRAQNRDERLENAQRDLMELQKESEESKTSGKRYKIHDATVEKIGELLKTNPNGLLLVRDELSGWLSSLDRVGRDGDREFFLEAWNGKGSYDVDRIIRGTLRIPALCLSILGGIPPSKIESYVESAVLGGAGNDGLLQRFGLMVHADFKKDWRMVDRAPNKPAYERVKNAFFSLDQLKFEKHPTEDNALIFRFDSEAQEIFYGWLTRLETRIRAEENESDAFVSHISKYRKLVPALALQFFLLKKVDNPNISERIDAASLTDAIEWSRHLETHARRVYSLALNPQIHAARSFAQKIKQGKIIDGVRLRDIYRHQWSHLKSRTSVDIALAVLIECNWLVVEEVRPATGAPFEIIRLNPSLIQLNEAQNQLDRTDITPSSPSVSSVNPSFELGAIA